MSQMKVPFSPPDISEAEIELVGDVLRSGWITTGPKTKEFETQIADHCGTGRAACLASATAAMELVLRVLGVGPGDEVITSAYTYTASASVAEHVGAHPVLIDIDPGDVGMSAAQLERAITERTKAIIPVDIGGIPADYDALRRVIDSKRDLFRPSGAIQSGLGRIAVIGDCAHSFGAKYKGRNVAQLSDFACFSFHAVKNLTTAEGGAIAFSDVGGVAADDLYNEFQLYSLHGQNKDALAKTRIGAWEYDIKIPGYKCNMTDIAAAMGLVQLERLPGLTARREELVARYDSHFAGTKVKPLNHAGEHYYGSHHLYIVTVDGFDESSRNSVIEQLAERGISANVHYKPLPMMTAYKNMGYDIADFPNAYEFYKKEITLPLHTLLTDEQVDYTAEAVLDII